MEGCRQMLDFLNDLPILGKKITERRVNNKKPTITVVIILLGSPLNRGDDALA